MANGAKMEKRNVVQPGRTTCDICGRTAVDVRGGRSRCIDHSGIKQASADTPLKSAAEQLSKNHK
jgi:hypothetical protein